MLQLGPADIPVGICAFMSLRPIIQQSTITNLWHAGVHKMGGGAGERFTIKVGACCPVRTLIESVELS